MVCSYRLFSNALGLFHCPYTANNIKPSKEIVPHNLPRWEELVWGADLNTAVYTNHRAEREIHFWETTGARCRMFNPVDKLTLK